MTPKKLLSPKQTTALVGVAAASVLIAIGAAMLFKAMKDIDKALDSIK